MAAPIIEVSLQFYEVAIVIYHDTSTLMPCFFLEVIILNHYTEENNLRPSPQDRVK